MTVENLTRRAGATLVGLAAAAALIAGCSSSGGGNPSTSSSTGAGASSTSTGSGSSSSSDGGGAVVGNAFCAGFKNNDLAGLQNANSAAEVVKAWDQYAKDAPSEIKAQVQDIDKYLHDVVDKNYTDIAQAGQKIGADAQAIGAYYAAHCHA